METKNKLKSFFTEHWKYMAVSAACKLNVFDYLQEAKTAKQLAKELSLQEEKTELLLNALLNIDFLTKKDEFFCLNSLSELLTENNPESLKYACLNWSGEHLNAWQQLDFSIKTGKSSFEEIYGLPFFDYLKVHPEKLHAYHKAMYEYAKDDYKNFVDVIDFSKHKSILDVGGGYGAFIENLSLEYPKIDCILFDLPEVISQVYSTVFQKISGDFFKEIPKKAEAIVLSRILHDWNTEKASLILENCFQALPKNGTLYLIENCSDRIKTDLSLLSLNMTAMCEGYERTSTEFIALAEKGGFHFKKEIKLNELQTILTFKK